MKRTLILLLVSCGGGDSEGIDAPSIDSPAIDGPGPAFVLTSPMLVEGAAFDVVNTCDGPNTSPQLDWVGAPAVMSFAVVLTDKANMLIHSVIYDIPSTRTGLPADVDKAFAPADVPGAHQTRTLGAGIDARGYFGPCPPAQDPPHTYEFALYALDVATLPGASMTTTKEDAEKIILQHDLAKTVLTGTRDR